MKKLLITIILIMIMGIIMTSCANPMEKGLNNPDTINITTIEC